MSSYSDTETLQQSATGRVALALLAFGEERTSGELSVSTIADRVGRERSQVSRMLKVLAAAGLLEQNPSTRAYRLGWRMHHLANHAGDQRLLLIAKPALRDLVVRTRETALMSVLSGNRSFTVARECSTQSLQAGGWVGRTSPLHASASGRALILNMSDEEVAVLVRDDLGAAGLGPRAPKTLQAVLSVLKTERSRGYTVACDHLEEGLTSVGSPIIDADGQILATINVSGPTSRLVNHVESLGEQLRLVAKHVSARLHQSGHHTATELRPGGAG